MRVGEVEAGGHTRVGVVGDTGHWRSHKRPERRGQACCSTAGYTVAVGGGVESG